MFQAVPLWYAFEFIGICIGKYGDIPKIPEFPKNKGPEVFKGKVMHSMEYCKLDKEDSSQLLKGKKVAVIGYKKSAIDLAVECAEANQEALLIIGLPEGPTGHFKLSRLALRKILSFMAI